MIASRKSTPSPVTVIFAVIAFVLTPGLFAEDAQAQYGGLTLNRGIADEPVTLDPQYAGRPSERAVLADLFLGLTAEDAAGNIVPGAAESWEVSEDGRTYTFRLRRDNLWTDGRPIRADDFVFAFGRLLAPKSATPYASLFYNIENAEALHRGKLEKTKILGVRAKNNQTLIITLVAPAPDFPSRLAHHSAYPVRRDIIEREGDSWTLPGRFITNGPYFLMEWMPGRFLQLDRNPKFHDADSVILETIYYYPAGDADAAIERFLAGELDIFAGVPRDRVAALFQAHAEALRLYPTLAVEYLVINTSRPPLDDPKVREALALAIDGQSLLRNVLGGGEIPASSIVPAEIANFEPPPRTRPQGDFPVPRPYTAKERRAMARDLLDDSGFGVKDTLRITLQYNLGETHRKVVEAVAGMWRSIGIKTDLYSTDYVVHYNDLAAADFDVARAGWIADYNDPTAILMVLDASRERFNYGRFSDGEFDRLMKRATVQLAPSRGESLHAAAARAMSLTPVIPLYFRASRNLVGAHVAGWMDNVRDLHPSRYLSLNGRPAKQEQPPEAAPEQSPEAAAEQAPEQQ